MPTPDLSDVQKANVVYHARLAPHYHRQPFLRDDNRSRVRGILEDVQRRAGSQRLLDVGCGAGFIFDAGHDLFEKLDGVDLTAEMLARVELRPNLTTRMATAEALPFPDGIFNVVTCYGVLHHIENVGVVLAEARRVLRPGGVFYADEVPSGDFRQAVSSLDSDAAMSDLLRSEWWKIAGDAERYEELGIEQEATRSAMVQCYRKDDLRPERLEALLASCGFRNIDIRFRWFLGQAQIRDGWGEQAARYVEEYLISLLPLTRHLFKNLMIVAS